MVVFLPLFLKGDNNCDSVFDFLCTKPVRKRGQH